MRFALLFSVAWLASMGVSACGGTVADTAGRAVDDSPGAIDSKVVHVRLEHVSLGSGGRCNADLRSVDYDRETHVMAWPGCALADGPSYGVPGKDYPTVSRVLSASEAASVEDALRSVTYVEKSECGGYDGSEYFMTTTARDGSDEHKYSAANINCYDYRRAPKIVGVYELLAKLRG